MFTISFKTYGTNSLYKFFIKLQCNQNDTFKVNQNYMDRVKRIWYLSPMRAAKVQASLRIRAVSPDPSLLAHTSSESRGTFRQKARSLAPLNGWACIVKICHDGMLEDTNLLDGAHISVAATILSVKMWLFQSMEQNSGMEYVRLLIVTEMKAEDKSKRKKGQ